MRWGGSSPPAHGGRRAEPIRVAVRLRPWEEEPHEGGDRAEGVSVWRAESLGERCCVALAPGTPKVHSTAYGGASSSTAAAGGKAYPGAKFYFDMCFDGRSRNREVFEAAARDVVRSCLDGINATVLAYGQTNSGKTHSILGTLKEPGILPLAMHDIFKLDGGSKIASFKVRVSYFEIFNERVIDLLAAGPRRPEGLPVKEDAERGFFVQGLSEVVVRSAKEVLRLIERGEDRRRYSETRWNECSSRSHVLFTLSLERAGEDCADEARPRGVFQASKLSIVDLAGCENHKLEPSEDGRYINRSLFFLGEVISRLCSTSRGDGRSASRRPSPQPCEAWPPDAPDGDRGVVGPFASTVVRRGRDMTPRRSCGATASERESRSPSRLRERGDFIPYRDSKLTRILRSSLGGNAVTLLLVTAHPAVYFVEQTMTSLRFASKARRVENYIGGPEESAKRGDEQSTIDAQQRMIESLQSKLQALEGRKDAPPLDAATMSELQRLLERSKHDVGARGRSYDDLVEGIVGGCYVDPRTMQKLQGLMRELIEREQQLALKARLLSEREWQLGQLHEKLGGHSDFAPLGDDGAEVRQASRRGPPAGARHGPPDEGGGLPVVDCGDAAPLPRREVAHPPRPPPAAPGAVGSAGWGAPLPGARCAEAPEPPSAFQQVQSRAEDIMCLRSHGYVTRQQVPMGASKSSPAAPSAAEARGAPRDPQKDLVERLLYVAVQQINRVGGPPGGGPPEPDSDAGPPHRHGPCSSAEVAAGPSRHRGRAAERPPHRYGAADEAGEDFAPRALERTQ